VDDQIALGQGQDEFYALVNFAQEFPGLTTTSYFARRGFAEEHPDTLKDVLRALLNARRQIQDPQVLQTEIAERLEMEPAEARAVSDAYLALGVWDLNGGYDSDAVQNNLDFLIGLGELPPGMRAEDVADLSHLQAVLDEIGRR
jgi:ABC-type nitrate/sulfonate/bicarbonate transport system substrate-binding protein